MRTTRKKTFWIRNRSFPKADYFKISNFLICYNVGICLKKKKNDILKINRDYPPTLPPKSSLIGTFIFVQNILFLLYQLMDLQISNKIWNTALIKGLCHTK